MKGQSLQIRGNIENQDGLSDEKTTLLFRVLSKETENMRGMRKLLILKEKEEKEREKERMKKNEKERERERSGWLL